MAHLEALNFQMPSAFKDTWRGALAGHGLLPRGFRRGQIHAALAYSKHL